jgi:hypothetical protein
VAFPLYDEILQNVELQKKQHKKEQLELFAQEHILETMLVPKLKDGEVEFHGKVEYHEHILEMMLVLELKCGEVEFHGKVEYHEHILEVMLVLQLENGEL